MKLLKSSWPFKVVRRRLKLLVCDLLSILRTLLTFRAGEQGKVDESMREMAAIEALKSEKAEKEVRLNGKLTYWQMLTSAL